MNQDSFPDDYVYIYRAPNSIELVGYAMNDISSAIDLEPLLPNEYRTMLSRAHALLEEVREHLYNH